MHYFIVAFFAGFVNKMHDDLSDNPLLEKFKSPTLMEFLKGVHYILLTTVSLHNPVFFMLLYLIVSVNSLSDPNAWSGPYESSLLYAFSLIYVLVQYENLPQLNVLDVCLMIAMLSFIVTEPHVIQQHIEFSIWKLIARVFFLCGLLYMIVLPIFTVTLKYIFAYYIGYCLLSVFSQYYSLYKTAKKRKRPRTVSTKVAKKLISSRQ